MQEFQFDIAGCAFDFAPVLTHVAFVSCSEEHFISIPECLPFQGEWGENNSAYLMDEDTHPLPKKIHIIYLSIIEHKFYIINSELSSEKISELLNIIDDETGMPIYNKLIVGMAPFGHIGVWLTGDKKETLMETFHGQEITVEAEQFFPGNPSASIDSICDFYINTNDAASAYLQENGLPPRDLFDRYMQQFCYRYLPMFQRWNEEEERWEKAEVDEGGQLLPEFEFIEEALWDGTHDKLHDGGLLNYHMAGKPKKLAIQWYIKKSQYTAYLWFEDEIIRSAFEKFYGAHRDTKVDFIIRIDPEKNKYELALYRYGLQEPVVISDEAYQMIVFKNKFEHYRSENYDQPRGAWVW